jgi:RecA/RadA recombinase
VTRHLYRDSIILLPGENKKSHYPRVESFNAREHVSAIALQAFLWHSRIGFIPQMGLRARHMSQALRKLTGIISKS